MRRVGVAGCINRYDSAVPNQTLLKTAISAALDRFRDQLAAFGDDIFSHAEVGFREDWRVEQARAGRLETSAT